MSKINMPIKNEYTVYEVAEILQTNPETVRKWIRENKLKAIPGNSKKEGIRVEDSSLQDFLEENSKYSKIALTSATAALITGGLAMPAFLLVKAYRENQSLANAIIKSSEVIKLLEEEINKEKQTVAEIEKNISILKNDIETKNKRINDISQMISELKGDPLEDQTETNSSDDVNLVYANDLKEMK